MKAKTQDMLLTVVADAIILTAAAFVTMVVLTPTPTPLGFVDCLGYLIAARIAYQLATGSRT